jgi:hypothetical protein
MDRKKTKVIKKTRKLEHTAKRLNERFMMRKLDNLLRRLSTPLLVSLCVFPFHVLRATFVIYANKIPSLFRDKMMGAQRLRH